MAISADKLNQKILALAVTLAMWVMPAAPSLLAQAVSARLEGVVSDPNQAVVPGAEVVITNSATNIAYEAVTNESG